MNKFTIVIWQYTKPLYLEEVEYSTYNEADCYAHGAFKVFMLLGKKPTGISVK